MSKDYEAQLEALQVQIVEIQAAGIEQGRKTLIIFEGRDAAGKDGAIKRLTENMAPRLTRVVALPKPTERESSQWYFQRYVPHLPAAGETVIFNRSWYNRAGVEPVMGFCTPQQHADFLRDVEDFERLLANSGITIIKLWLDISREEQAKRLSERESDPIKRFKVSPMDKEAQARWDLYSKARDEMLTKTSFDFAPWTAIKTDKKKTARLNIIRHILHAAAQSPIKVDKPDSDVVLSAKSAKGKLNP
ncbi:polyphosphate kinase [Brevundimonas sp. GN22]|uniref:polyphosphate kinase 2 n=1 Tax=Brevundimonas pishanensis TaxID=2896315 RepID=UPI001FA76466|nr:polyphosphate kinase 2 [Brevundimonas pishanensis]